MTNDMQLRALRDCREMSRITRRDEGSIHAAYKSLARCGYVKLERMDDRGNWSVRITGKGRAHLDLAEAA
jgi:hypothetical protein